MILRLSSFNTYTSVIFKIIKTHIPKVYVNTSMIYLQCKLVTNLEKNIKQEHLVYEEADGKRLGNVANPGCKGDA